MHYLVATDSVHTTAAACDYLDERLDGPGVDRVTVLTVTDGDTRDAGDAANVARARLAGRATVEVADRAGDPAETILDAVEDLAADVLVLGARSGAPGADTDLGSTARAVLAGVPIPAVIVPVEHLDHGGVE